MEREEQPGEQREDGNSGQEVFTYKQGQYSPRKRKEAAAKLASEIGIELIYDKLSLVEACTKRIEEAASKREEVYTDSANKTIEKLKNDFERCGMKAVNSTYKLEAAIKRCEESVNNMVYRLINVRERKLVSKRAAVFCAVVTFFSLFFVGFMAFKCGQLNERLDTAIEKYGQEVAVLRHECDSLRLYHHPDNAVAALRHECDSLKHEVRVLQVFEIFAKANKNIFNKWVKENKLK